MARAGEKRLRRLEAHWPPPAEETERRERRKWRWYLGLADIIREAAVEAGIDPLAIPSLQYTEGAAIAHLQAMADTPELAAADAAAIVAESKGAWSERHPGEPDPHEAYLAELDRIGQHYLDGSNPGSEGSFRDWLAWALVQEALTADPSLRRAAADSHRGRFFSS